MTDISITFLRDELGENISTLETGLRNRLENLDDDPTTGDLLRMQQDIQRWSISIQLESTIVKEFSDALKGIIQKMN